MKSVIHTRVRLFQLSANRGYPDAINVGIEARAVRRSLDEDSELVIYLRNRGKKGRANRLGMRVLFFSYSSFALLRLQTKDINYLFLR